MRIFVVYSLQLVLTLIKSFYHLLENWLEGFGFTGRCLAGKNFRGYNLRGCDFSSCNLRGAQMSGVVGGFSWVRPIALAASIAFSLCVNMRLVRLLPVPLNIVLVPRQLQFCLYASLVTTILLKFLITFFYSKDLPKLKLLNNTLKVNIKNQFLDKIKAVLIIFPTYASFGCCIFLQNTVSTESNYDKLRLFALACLFGLLAISSWVWIVGEMFIFYSSFRASDLNGANLAGAKFWRCNFSLASLHSANLSGGDFRHCNFSGADLRFADFRGATLKGAVLKDVQAKGAIGLEEAVHGSIN